MRAPISLRSPRTPALTCGLPRPAYCRRMHVPPRLTGLAELTRVRMLWFSDWYDGPVTGLAVHDASEYWFVMVTDDGTPVVECGGLTDGEHWYFDPRIYVLHRLTPEELAVAWDAHRSFAALNMPGCMHTPPCPVASAIDAGELDALRERWPPEREDAYLNAPAIGWFKAERTA